MKHQCDFHYNTCLKKGFTLTSIRDIRNECPLGPQLQSADVSERLQTTLISVRNFLILPLSLYVQQHGNEASSFIKSGEFLD